MVATLQHLTMKAVAKWVASIAAADERCLNGIYTPTYTVSQLPPLNLERVGLRTVALRMSQFLAVPAVLLHFSFSRSFSGTGSLSVKSSINGDVFQYNYS